MKRVRIYEEKPSEAEIDKAVKVLRDGGIVIYPTDTVYALGCDALNVRAVERICQIKGINPQKVNLSIICRELSWVSEYAKLSNLYFKLLKRNLPGAFTFILPTSSSLPKIYKNRKTVGIRIPDNAITLALVEALGNPLLTTSVAIDEEEPEYGTDPELIAERYEAVADLIIDGGEGGTIPSTTVDCTGDAPVILREGKGELQE
ncbi:L-threonylcarbamoyladenylate synthase [Barnesiella viscericola]|uniref:Threonylcarbamoyl-AMP synthase n=1 Tax=Barnesiella viscericola TaxID=397865 RepID=A0A921SW38_9BACT|nr:L-threonylcarbamoyladenylate synthase [Barnesiella viscericola]HJG89977.1 threonylcarbamoyl-AMP synthase [Barnesiella viscericola]